ncbi:MAG: lysylphosphatidylglycerol synthase transmembrane domain-containing protein [Bacteroidota bacterium]
MNPSLKKTLNIAIPMLLGLGLVAYSYFSTSATERGQIVFYVKNVDPFWVAISLLLGILSHLSRAIRWNYLLQPLGYQPKISNNLFIVLIAYFANLGIPRSGEVLRATALTKYEKVPFEKGFGTIVTERVIDLIMLLLVIILTLILQTDVILDIAKTRGLNMVAMPSVAVAGVIGLIIFLRIIKKSNSKLVQKLRGFLTGLLQGILSIFKMEKKWSFIGHTLFIWLAYIGMFWVIKYTLPETEPLGLGPILVAFIAGAFAISATNGGIGLYPIAVSAALGIYGVDSVSGDAFGWIMWISQTLMVVVFGAISFMVLPLLNKSS